MDWKDQLLNAALAWEMELCIEDTPVGRELVDRIDALLRDPEVDLDALAIVLETPNVGDVVGIRIGALSENIMMPLWVAEDGPAWKNVLRLSMRHWWVFSWGSFVNDSDHQTLRQRLRSLVLGEETRSLVSRFAGQDCVSDTDLWDLPLLGDPARHRFVTYEVRETLARAGMKIWYFLKAQAPTRVAMYRCLDRISHILHRALNLPERPHPLSAVFSQNDSDL